MCRVIVSLNAAVPVMFQIALRYNFCTKFTDTWTKVLWDVFLFFSVFAAALPPDLEILNSKLHTSLLPVPTQRALLNLNNSRLQKQIHRKSFQFQFLASLSLIIVQLFQRHFRCDCFFASLKRSSVKIFTLKRITNWWKHLSGWIKARALYLHAAVGHRHGVVSGGVAGHLTVVGAAGRSHDVTRVHEIRTGRVSTFLSPENTTGIQCSLK